MLVKRIRKNVNSKCEEHNITRRFCVLCKQNGTGRCSLCEHNKNKYECKLCNVNNTNKKNKTTND